MRVRRRARRGFESRKSRFKLILPSASVKVAPFTERPFLTTQPDGFEMVLTAGGGEGSYKQQTRATGHFWSTHEGKVRKER
jgi:hypothetical protein